MLTIDDSTAIENIKRFVLHRGSNNNVMHSTEFLRKRREVSEFIASQDNNYDSTSVFFSDILNLLSSTAMLYNPRRVGRIIDFVILMSEPETTSNGPAPLAEETINKIEKHIFKNLTPDMVGHELSPNCPICQEQYSQDDTVSMLPCNGKHYYHTECINEWFRVNNICPICRDNIANKI